MPIKKSAVKRAKQNIVRRDKNRALKKNFREAIKSISKDLQTKKTEEISVKVSKAFQALDKAAKNNAIHKNTAARKKSRLVKRVNLVLEKGVAPKSVKEKGAPKKETAKKTTNTKK